MNYGIEMKDVFKMELRQKRKKKLRKNFGPPPSLTPFSPLKKTGLPL